MKSILIRLGVMALMISALASCGGGSAGAPGATGPAGTPGTPGGTIVASNLAATDWLALKPNIDQSSIKVDMSTGKPVVSFEVTDQYGNPLAGLGNEIPQTGANASLPAKSGNFFFTLAKLVTVTGGPSKWVNYLVVTPKPAGTAGAVVNGGLSWVGTYPTAESEGTLVDNGDGTYKYTFLRNVTQSAAIVAALTDDATHSKSDLGDVSYDSTKTHRLGIVIQGSQPGTGTNTPDGVQLTTPVPLVNTFNIGYDFVPNGGAVTVTRDIVEKASCSECHQGRGIGHVTSNTGTTTDPAKGTPAGAFIGRNDPRLCVTCHTDQTKYGFANVTEGTNVDGSPALTSKYYRTTTGEAAFTYPRLIHQTHMGNKLVKTGYNLNGHCNEPGAIGYSASKATANQAQCFNEVQYPQDVRNCTKCHDGSATATNKTANGDNWMNVPSRLACGACHDGIDFTTGTGITLFDRDTDVKAKVAVGTTQTGHQGGIQTDDSKCTTCHTAAGIALYHGPISVTTDASGKATADATPPENSVRLPATAVASLRTMSATITGAAVDANGGVTVNFTLADSAGAVVDYATSGVVPTVAGTSPSGLPFKSLNFTLAKLVPAANGASTYWKNFTGKCNVNNSTPNPDMVALETTPGTLSSIPASAYHNILQGYSEVSYGQAYVAPTGTSAGKPYMSPGILTSLGGGKWTYKFALVNATTVNGDGTGDVRTITRAINLATTAPTAAGGSYAWSGSSTSYTSGDQATYCPDDGVTPVGGYVYAAPTYDSNATFRIGMIFNKNDPLGADNVTNATYDFVPAGGTPTVTRNIVTMENCATCHAGRKIHKGYATELCVTCHNQNTSDPSDSDASVTVDLKRFVHKLHDKGKDFWVHGEQFGTGSMTGFPGNVMKCTVCHNENATKPGTTTKLENAANWYTTPTAEACGTCHDDAVAQGHIQTTGSTHYGYSDNVELCTVCHGAGSADGLDAKSVHLKLIP